MSIIKFNKRQDFGTDYYIQVLNIRRWSLLQVSVSWNYFTSFPYVQIKSGSGSLLSIIFWAYKFGMDVDIFSRTWKWDYINSIEDNECNYD